MAARRQDAGDRGLTAGHAVGQAAVELPEQLLVNGPEREREELNGVDDEPRGDEHVAEDEVAQELRLQQPHEVHGGGAFTRSREAPQEALSSWKKGPDPGTRLKHNPALNVRKITRAFIVREKTLKKTLDSGDETHCVLVDFF